jgi:hypothetical protein
LVYGLARCPRTGFPNNAWFVDGQNLDAITDAANVVQNVRLCSAVVGDGFQGGRVREDSEQGQEEMKERKGESSSGRRCLDTPEEMKDWALTSVLVCEKTNDDRLGSDGKPDRG